eukprot:gene26848-biopygen5462
MISCHEEGVRDRNPAGIEAADPGNLISCRSRASGIGSFDSSSIPVTKTLLVARVHRNRPVVCFFARK